MVLCGIGIAAQIPGLVALLLNHILLTNIYLYTSAFLVVVYFKFAWNASIFWAGFGYNFLPLMAAASYVVDLEAWKKPKNTSSTTTAATDNSDTPLKSI